MEAPKWQELYRQARQASLRKNAANPLGNPLLSTVIRGALKGLKMVAMVSFAYEVAIVAQMLEKFIADRQRDLEEEEQQKQQIGFY